MARENLPFILNGHAYEDAAVVWGGIPLPGCTGFSASVTQTKTNNLGAGRRPVSRSRGAENYEGSITMDLDTRTILMAAFGVTRTIDIPPQVVIITVQNEDLSFKTFQLRLTEFLDDGVEASSGDENITREYGILPGSFDGI